MLLKASRIFGQLVNKSINNYNVTPQLMRPLSAEFLLD